MSLRADLHVDNAVLPGPVSGSEARNPLALRRGVEPERGQVRWAGNRVCLDIVNRPQICNLGTIP